MSNSKQINKVAVRVMRRKWIVTFETGFVSFTSVIANEEFARKWASNLPDTPRGEKITDVRWEAVNY
jgi:hypothetical protein